MKTRIVLITTAALFIVGCSILHIAGANETQTEDKHPTRLGVVWTSGDADVAHRMVFMYVHNAQKRSWYDQTLLIVWGPSARLLAGDKDLQTEVRAMIKDGVKIQACKACADMYGVSPALTELGIEVKYMGVPLTKILQDDGWDVMTF
jgi:hypothetical protein